MRSAVRSSQPNCLPRPNHTAKDRSLSVRLSASAPNGFIVYSHSGDDFRICRDFVRERLGLPTAASRAGPKPRAARSRETRAEASAARRGAFVRAQIAAIVAGLVPIHSTDGDRYLRDERGIDTDALADILERTDAVGWHPKVYFNEPERHGRPRHPLHGQLLGCIIGIMTDPVTALPTGAISRTYLHDGKKVGKAKSLGEGDGVVRISPDDEVTQGLHLAEGLESAWSAAALGFRPIWSTGSMSILAKFPGPFGDRGVVRSSPTTTQTTQANARRTRSRCDGVKQAARPAPSSGRGSAISTTRLGRAEMNPEEWLEKVGMRVLPPPPINADERAPPPNGEEAAEPPRFSDAPSRYASPTACPSTALRRGMCKW